MGVAVAGERTWLFSGVAVVAPSPGIIAGRVSGHLGVPQRQRELGGGALFGTRRKTDGRVAALCVTRCGRFLRRSDQICLLYTSDAADEEDSVDLGGRRI